ncbi:MAG TPA: DUF1043 family protein [Gammaproteobacteria bacterium]|nr:DUF1043 family protein [Gammaproteobacteria bacterium]
MTSGISLGWAWAIGLIAFACGVLAGIAVGQLLQGGNRRVREMQQRLDALQKELDDYREQVGQHFLKTSELVQKMTDSYREVYEHLASGSQALCEGMVDTPKLDIPGQPSLEAAATTEPQHDSPAQTRTESKEDADEADACLGDAPRVPTLDDEMQDTSATPRKPSP